MRELLARITPSIRTARTSAGACANEDFRQKWRGSILEYEHRAAVRTLRFAAIRLDRQVDARMRIPQRHFRQRARQRQLRARDLVTTLRVGRLGGMDGWAAHGLIGRRKATF